MQMIRSIIIFFLAIFLQAEFSNICAQLDGPRLPDGSYPITSEDGTSDSVQFRLTYQPGPDTTVIVGVIGLDTTEGYIEHPLLYFTESNWNNWQSVIITGVDDDIVDGSGYYTLAVGIISPWSNLNELTTDSLNNLLGYAPVTVTNIDNDSPTFLINSTNDTLITTESGTKDSISVVLNAAPTSNVVIDISGIDASEGSTDSTQFTFTPSNWNTPKYLIITGVNDGLIDGDISYTVTLSVNNSSSDDSFDNIVKYFVVTNMDDDNSTAGITIIETGGVTYTTENEIIDSFGIVLNSMPTTNVALTITGGDDTEGKLKVNQVVFSPSTWNIPQYVMIAGLDDDIADGDISYKLTVSVQSLISASEYLGISETFTVTNTDNEVKGIHLFESNSSTQTSEDATSDTIMVTLNAESVSEVSVDITELLSTEGKLNTTELVFDASNWSSGLPLIVTGVDDNIADGNITYNLDFNYNEKLSSTNTKYIQENDRGFCSFSGTIDTNHLGYTGDGFLNTENDTLVGVTYRITSGSGLCTFNIRYSNASNTISERPVNIYVNDVLAISNLSLPVTPDWDTWSNVETSFNLIEGENRIRLESVTAEGLANIDFISITGNNIVTTACSGDVYYGLSSSVPVTNTDNDSPGIILQNTNGKTSTSENGLSDTIMVKLNTQPTVDIEITVLPLDITEHESENSTLSFTAEDWNIAKPFIIKGVDDLQADSTQSYYINFEISETIANAEYSNVKDSILISNADNDTARIIIQQTNGVTITDENGKTDTLLVALDAQPEDDVLILISGLDNTEGTISATNLTFTKDNYSIYQPVIITGLDDVLVDNNISYSFNFTTDNASSSNEYNNKTGSVETTNLDNDTAGIILISNSDILLTSEEGTSDSFQIKLNAQPQSEVVITVTAYDATENYVNPLTFSFNSSNWDSPQTITVEGKDDFIDDSDIPYYLYFGTDNESSDINFNNLKDSIGVINEDNDTSGIRILPSYILTTSESGTKDTLKIKLKSQPQNEVLIEILGLDNTEHSINVPGILFNQQNWDSVQNIIVTGKSDDIVDGTIEYPIELHINTLLSDESYFNKSEIVIMENIDEDSAKLVIYGDNIETNEDFLSDTFGIAISSSPYNEVKIAISSIDTTEQSINTDTVTFTPDNWNKKQNIIITGKDDNLVDGTICNNLSLSIINAISDSSYRNLMQTVETCNKDNDMAAIIFKYDNSITTSEKGSTDTLFVRLNTRPTGNVRLNLDNVDETEFSVASSTLQFNNSDWNVYKPLIFQGVDDFIIDGDFTEEIRLAVVNGSSDDTYQDISEIISLTNRDNDTARINITPPENLVTSENQLADSFYVYLNSEPSQNVIFNILGLDKTEGKLNKDQIIFTTSNWNKTQGIILTGVDDDEIDGNISYTIFIDADNNNSDTTYAELSKSIEVTNLDNDAAGITILETNGSTSTTEFGTTDVFRLVLNTQPTADVEVIISDEDTTECTLSENSFIFSRNNWDSLRTVIISGKDDYYADGDIKYNLKVATDLSSADGAYHNLEYNLQVTNFDNDSADIILSNKSGLLTNEQGKYDTTSLQLSSKPISDVVVAVSGIDTTEGTSLSKEFLFTRENWDTPQQFKLAGVNDPLVDGAVTYSIKFSVINNESDTTYKDKQTIITAKNVDDDTARILCEPLDTLITSEDGDIDTVAVSLSTQPISQVTISVLVSDYTEASADKTILTFNPKTWDSVQYVSVIGLDDALDDDTVNYNVLFSTENSISDKTYRNVTAVKQGINIDNDKINRAPLPVSDNFKCILGKSVSANVLKNDSDPDNDSIFVNGMTLWPLFGNLQFNSDGSFTYTNNGNGSNDSFIYQVCDKGMPSECATGVVTIKIIADTNKAPLAKDDYWDIYVNDVLRNNFITNNDKDPNGDILYADITPVEYPQNGTVSISEDGSFVYTPQTDFLGADNFTYRVHDNQNPALYDTAVVTIKTHLPSENNNPVAADDYFTILKNKTLERNILINDIDPDGDKLTANNTPVTYPNHGTVTLHINGDIFYTPDTDFVGLDSFQYKTCDNVFPSLCDIATVYINILLVYINNAPIAINDTFSFEQETTFTGNVIDNDYDSDSNNLRTAIDPVFYPVHGTVNINTTGSFIYTPATGFYGADKFSYLLCDDGSPEKCDTGWVMLNIFSNDKDNDGILNKIEGTDDPDNDNIPNDEDTDSDNDGIPDAVEGVIDTDKDNLPNFVDTDSDNDEIPDSTEGVVDTDGDELANYIDRDSDNDSLADIFEGIFDIDYDLIPNYIDTDSDGDGLTDLEEGMNDCDDDGIIDAYDADDCESDIIKVPQAITPNGDNQNDEFYIPELEGYNHVSINIFNRWGNTVFYQENYDNKWDGKANKGLSIGTELPSGTYFYDIVIKGTGKRLTGYIYLKR